MTTAIIVFVLVLGIYACYQSYIKEGPAPLYGCLFWVFGFVTGAGACVYAWFNIIFRDAIDQHGGLVLLFLFIGAPITILIASISGIIFSKFGIQLGKKLHGGRSESKRDETDSK